MQEETGNNPVGLFRSALSLSDDLLLNALRYLLVLLEEHGVVTTTLCSGTKVCGVAEHLSKRNICLNHLAAADIFHTLDTSTTCVNVTDNVAHVLLRHCNLYLHDRLKKYRVTFRHSILECHGTSDVECHLGRVDLMVRSIIYICSYAEYRESAKDTGLCSLFDTFADSRNVFLRNSTADNGRSELECLFAVRIHRCEVYLQ